MELEKVAADRRRKRNIQIMFIIFMGLLIFFTLFSNTLQSLTLPKVRTEKPAAGSLVFTIEGSGILQPLAEARLSNAAGWKVQKILVKEGDRVKKGQKLIIYDSKSAERELEDEITNLKKQQIEQQNIQDQFIQSSMEGDELKIRNARRTIETGKLNLHTQERKINEMRDKLTSQQDITAPFDGIIAKLNAVEGLTSAGEPDVLVSNSSLGYRFDISADSKVLSSLGISIGEKIEVEVNTVQEQQARMIEGTIEEVANEQPRIESSSSEEGGQTITIPQKVLRIKVVNSELKGGEQAKIKLEKGSRQEGLLISNKAIHEDRSGMFVYKIEEQRGALGNVFVARKVLIHTSETNDKETMIQSDSLYEEELIILESSEPLQDGNRIRME
ncbi:efflux RND transporter periplasmic adaptor subunit [Paenibacillus macquariensis]|jgi:multidrug efflux pump subunit AcrA (membrane-fusion protein)|uniref:Multidrug efflux pump subunit AcrA (Membrane-fusion protein) n=1 Tax=Paenibacillus macquariensis TaxID=948756 RepID=A0ABY1KAM0_9BACL|nr:HlyD family efflux transporter periplasmic adaptor subunit [Paenibacillus macquariensis]MEC0093667.1 biotin/lipoyl-binding protein [Paenibacillus macquariensis]OAB31620.1 RND transporter [Paenibacillus macquariensis subsp. macquariensis]SIR51262.1 Multidrug efflux pump subunit AcrA (membrane-fusion protein) [Paenibacillus macquariensis]